MRFEEAAAGDVFHRGGPWFGVRVLSIGAGGSVVVDGVALPASLLVSYRKEFQRVILTGPCVVALAEREDEDVDAANATPTGRQVSQASEAVSVVAQNFAVTPWVVEWAAPVRARGLALYSDGGAAGAPVMAGTLNGYPEIKHTASAPWRRVYANNDWSIGVGIAGMSILALLGSAARMTPAGVNAVSNRSVDPGPVPYAVRATITGTSCNAGKALRLVANWELDP